MTRPLLMPVGAKEIAHALGVEVETVYQWTQRGLLPESPWQVSGRPAWPWGAIVKWAEQTGRDIINPPEEA